MVSTELHLPVFTVEIPLNRIPFEIAKAIVPEEQATTFRIAIVHKWNTNEALTDIDWLPYDKIFKAAKLPIFRPVSGNGGLNWSEWPKYKKSIEEHRKLYSDENTGAQEIANQISVFDFDEKTNTRILVEPDTVFNMVVREHFEHLENAMTKGELIIYLKNTSKKMGKASARFVLDEGSMKVADFVTYAKTFGIQVLIGEKKIRHVKKSSTEVARPKQERQDALAVELDEILSNMTRISPALAMAELKKRIGEEYSCIRENTGDGIKWERNNGDYELLNIPALTERIRNWKRKNKAKIQG